jgi:hypothetical protein
MRLTSARRPLGGTVTGSGYSVPVQVFCIPCLGRTLIRTDGLSRSSSDYVFPFAPSRLRKVN